MRPAKYSIKTGKQKKTASSSAPSSLTGFPPKETGVTEVAQSPPPWRGGCKKQSFCCAVYPILVAPFFTSLFFYFTVFLLRSSCFLGRPAFASSDRIALLFLMIQFLLHFFLEVLWEQSVLGRRPVLIVEKRNEITSGTNKMGGGSPPKWATKVATANAPRFAPPQGEWNEMGGDSPPNEMFFS